MLSYLKIMLEIEERDYFILFFKSKSLFSRVI